MKISELKKVLKKHGCFFVRNGGNHDIWYSPISKASFALPRHDSKEIMTGICQKILKEAGIKE